jgi:hypothetical protein
MGSRDFAFRIKWLNIVFIGGGIPRPEGREVRKGGDALKIGHPVVI